MSGPWVCSPSVFDGLVHGLTPGVNAPDIGNSHAVDSAIVLMGCYRKYARISCPLEIRGSHRLITHRA